MKMRTHVQRHGVLYEVVDDDGTVVWSKFVQFRRKGFFRPAGPAFREAAREQEASIARSPS